MGVSLAGAVVMVVPVPEFHLYVGERMRGAKATTIVIVGTIRYDWMEMGLRELSLVVDSQLQLWGEVEKSISAHKSTQLSARPINK